MDGEISDHDLLIRIDQKIDNICIQIVDHEARLRNVETWKNKLVGQISVSVAMLATAISVIVAFIMKKLGL